MTSIRALALLSIAACGGSAVRGGSVVTLRAACPAHHYWNGSACAAAGDAPAKLDAGKRALAEFKVDVARQALDDAEHAGPLDHDANVTLWEQRGIAAAYVDDEPTAIAAFDMLLALDPGHLLSYKLSPKATLVFEKVRTQDRAVPALDVNWPHGSKVGDPVALDLEVVADPKQFMRRATVFVRARGDGAWRATDLVLHPGDQHVVLPPVVATKPTSLELYLRAYDEHDNEVLAWADAARPREIPLRYDPPPPWYRTWWGITLVGSAVALGVGITVYELTVAPPDTISGTATVK